MHPRLRVVAARLGQRFNAIIPDMLRTTWTLDTLRTHRAEIYALAEQYGASNVRVFGSVARDEATPTSDIDLLVTAKPGTSIFDLVGLWQAIQELLGCEVSLITDGTSDKRFLRRIAPDVVAL